MGNVKAKMFRGDWNHFEKSLRLYLSNIARKHEIKELQKISTILGSAHTMREVLM